MSVDRRLVLTPRADPPAHRAVRASGGTPLAALRPAARGVRARCVAGTQAGRGGRRAARARALVVGCTDSVGLWVGGDALGVWVAWGVAVAWRLSLVLSLVCVLARRVFELVVLLGRGERSEELEILVVGHELSILRRRVSRPRFAARDRLVLAALSRVLPRRSWSAFLVRPETLLRWHRRLVARHRTYPHRRPGRPPIDGQVRELILRLARENTGWGYLRIVGELRKLGIDVSATLVRNVLRAAGVPPAPKRDRLAWRSFPRQRAATTLACDFLTVDTVSLRRVRARVHPHRQSPNRGHRFYTQPRRPPGGAAGTRSADGSR